MDLDKEQLFKALSDPLPKYGIQLKIAREWTWVVTNVQLVEPVPMLFDTEHQADHYAEIWRKLGKEHLVRIMKYDPVQ